jgi:hypothetical protein
MAQLLERCCRPLHINSQYAPPFLRKLQQKDIPAAGELLGRLQASRRLLEAHLGRLKRRPAVYKQLLDGMHIFKTLLETYHQQALQRIISQLSAAPVRPGLRRYLHYPEVSPAQFKQVQTVIQEFLHSLNTLYIFLKSGINKGKFAPLNLLPPERESLQLLVKTIGAFKALQEKNIDLLEQWKLQTIYINKLRTMN